MMPAIDGAANPFFNHFAIIAYALAAHDASVDQSFYFFEDGCCSFEELFGTDAVVHLDEDVVTKYGVTHWPGRALAYWVDDESILGVPIPGNLALTSSTSMTNNCVGSDTANGAAMMISKEWNSLAAVEGLADFYSAITWNHVDDNEDCELSNPFRQDWDLTGTWDTSAFAAFTCEDDPSSASYVVGGDWLSDVVNGADPAGCTGSMLYRGSRYDWTRFFWDLATNTIVARVPLSTIWEIWDDMEPFEWDEDSSTVDILDNPEALLFQACTDNSVWSECDDSGFLNGQYN